MRSLRRCADHTWSHRLAAVEDFGMNPLRRHAHGRKHRFHLCHEAGRPAEVDIRLSLNADLVEVRSRQVTGDVEILAHSVARARPGVANISPAPGERRHEAADFGGKVLTYRRVDEEIVDKVAKFCVPVRGWTEQGVLPGGELGGETIDQFRASAKARWAFLDEDHLNRLVAAYGSRVERIIGTAQSQSQPSHLFMWWYMEASCRVPAPRKYARPARPAAGFLHIPLGGFYRFSVTRTDSA